MKALIIGTSNCLLNGGVKEAIEELFGKENVVNLSLGASSGTFLSLFNIIDGIDFHNFDYVFFDSVLNEDWETRSGRLYSHQEKAARILYASLPDGVTYCYLSYVSKPDLFYGCIIEEIHKKLCIEFGINFISLRGIINHILSSFQIPFESAYKNNGHFYPPLIKRIFSLWGDIIGLLKKKKQKANIDSSIFFMQDIRPQAKEVVKYSTSLREEEFGIFDKNTKINLLEGYILGFRYVELGTQAILKLKSENIIYKRLTFSSDKPWMKVACFNEEIKIIKNSIIEICDDTDNNAEKLAEHTEGIFSFDKPWTNEAKISKIYYSSLSFDKIISKFEAYGNKYENYDSYYRFNKHLYFVINNRYSIFKDCFNKD